MNSNQLLAMGLGLHSPWVVLSSELIKEQADGEALHIHIDFKRGSQFKDETGSYCPVHDTVEKTWRHLSFFEHSMLFALSRAKNQDEIGSGETGRGSLGSTREWIHPVV